MGKRRLRNGEEYRSDILFFEKKWGYFLNFVKKKKKYDIMITEMLSDISASR